METKKNNYRKIYINHYGKIPCGYEIHHIDWNRQNNDLQNLIALPKKLHRLIHSYFGIVKRFEIEIMLDVYNSIKNIERHSKNSIIYKIQMKINKLNQKSVFCFENEQRDITNYSRHVMYKNNNQYFV